MSVPPGTEMFQFPGFASYTYVFSARSSLLRGLPHSETSGSTPARGFPKIIAACHVLHRLLAPRHPPDALLLLKTSELSPCKPRTGPIQQLSVAKRRSSEKETTLVQHCG
jgi:hypothetical protein